MSPLGDHLPSPSSGAFRVLATIANLMPDGAEPSRYCSITSCQPESAEQQLPGSLRWLQVCQTTVAAGLLAKKQIFCLAMKGCASTNTSPFCPWPLLEHPQALPSAAAGWQLQSCCYFCPAAAAHQVLPSQQCFRQQGRHSSSQVLASCQRQHSGSWCTSTCCCSQHSPNSQLCYICAFKWCL